MKYENINFKGYEFLQKLKIDSVLNFIPKCKNVPCNVQYYKESSNKIKM